MNNAKEAIWKMNKKYRKENEEGNKDEHFKNLTSTLLCLKAVNFAIKMYTKLIKNVVLGSVLMIITMINRYDF